MDVLAVDKDGAFVVIECKVTKACSSVLGQLLGYMAWVDRHMPESGLPVRGMIVAREVSPALALAVKYLSLVSLMVFECPGRKRLQRVM